MYCVESQQCTESCPNNVGTELCPYNIPSYLPTTYRVVPTTYRVIPATYRVIPTTYRVVSQQHTELHIVTYFTKSHLQIREKAQQQCIRVDKSLKVNKYQQQY